MKKDTVEWCIEKVGRKFQDNPISFLTESDLKLEIAYCLRKKEMSRPPRLSLEKKNFTKYKGKYLDRILNSSMRSHIHTEVNLGGRGNNYHIDVGIFREDVSGEIDGGTKRFEANSLEHALEIKFIKNRDNVGIQYFDNEIEKFSSGLENSTIKYLIVFSNKNPLEKGKRSRRGKETLKTLREMMEEIGFEFYHYYPVSKT